MPMNLNEDVDTLRKNFELVANELAKIIVGQELLIRHLFICLLCGGHALIEGVPGLGKTLIVRSLSKILNLKYSRIQFTPDLMPADIIGTNIVKEDPAGGRYFEFYKGPIFGQLILADEINRASPKTQSALLEAMQEEKVTVFGTQYQLVPPFMCWRLKTRSKWKVPIRCRKPRLIDFSSSLKLTIPIRMSSGKF
jgi:MoxR-like ATPase